MNRLNPGFQGTPERRRASRRLAGRRHPRYNGAPVSAPSPAPDSVVATIAERALRLELGTADLCFLVALHLRAEQAQLSSFQEEQLVEVFDQTAELVAIGGAGGTRGIKSATAAIARLRSQRLLARIDGLGVTRAPEYGLTRLAQGIAEYLVEDEALTPETLGVLVRALGDGLARIREAAQGADTIDEWRAGVVDPLLVAVADLIRGIERRQRSLDQQHERFQDEVRGLLEADWFGAIASCERLLASTSATLRELTELLLRDTHQLQSVLQDIGELAAAANQEAAEAAALRVADQLDRIAAWGAARQGAWSEYFQYVHRFLRDVVRLDPSRALAQRLRDQLAGASGRAFSLTVAAAPPLTLLRDAVVPPDNTPAVSRPRRRRDREPEVGPVDDPAAAFDARVADEVRGGARALSAVTNVVAGEVETDEQFAAAGRVADAVARMSTPQSALERPWVPVGEALVIEDWELPDDGRSE